MIHYFPLYYFALLHTPSPKHSKFSSLPLGLKHLEGVHLLLISLSPEYEQQIMQHYKGLTVFGILKIWQILSATEERLICQTLVPSPPVNGENRDVGTTSCLTSLHFCCKAFG